MPLLIDEAEFLSVFSNTNSGAYGRFKQSVLQFRAGELPPHDGKIDFLKELLKSIQRGEYFPSPPRGYLTQPKYNGVTRFIPVLSFADNLVYYFCLSRLTQDAAFERANNTYGGFQSAKHAIAAEEEELSHLEAEQMVDLSPYRFETSLNPKESIAIYKSFQRAAFAHSRLERVMHLGDQVAYHPRYGHTAPHPLRLGRLG